MRINNEVYPSIAMKSLIYNNKLSTSDKIRSTCTIFLLDKLMYSIKVLSSKKCVREETLLESRLLYKKKCSLNTNTCMYVIYV